MTFPLVTVIVLNYNGLAHLDQCLPSVLGMAYPRSRLELLLFDNGSSDGSVEHVRQKYPAVRVVAVPRNLGFAEGNNRAVADAKGEYVALLNNDMRVEADWLSSLVKACLCNGGDVCVASRILSWDGSAIDFGGAGLNFIGWGSQFGLGDSPTVLHKVNGPILFACGGALLISKRLFLDVGGFDPAYFAYFEDVDLGWRLWLKGHSVVMNADAVVYHRHHGTGGMMPTCFRSLLLERNALYTIFKNYSIRSLSATFPAALLLMAERAYQDLNGQGDGVSRGCAGNRASPTLREYLDHAMVIGASRGFRQVLRHGARILWTRSREALLPGCGRSMASMMAAEQSVSSPQLPDYRTGLARLLAGRQVLQALPVLREKRRNVQRARCRSDAEVFPLFRCPLVCNFGDERAVRAFRRALACFDLPTLFDPERPQVAFGDEMLQQSKEVSLALLQLMDRAWTLTGLRESAFGTGEAAESIAETSARPAVAALAGLHDLFWSLPEGPLPTVLGQLQAGCKRLLKGESGL